MRHANAKMPMMTHTLANRNATERKESLSENREKEISGRNWARGDKTWVKSYERSWTLIVDSCSASILAIRLFLVYGEEGEKELKSVNEMTTAIYVQLYKNRFINSIFCKFKHAHIQIHSFSLVKLPFIPGFLSLHDTSSRRGYIDRLDR